MILVVHRKARFSDRFLARKRTSSHIFIQTWKIFTTLSFSQCHNFSQDLGKSTLLNHLFGTNFREMDAFRGRSQTTKGIWMANCTGIEPCTIVMDLEGTDGRERGKARLGKLANEDTTEEPEAVEDEFFTEVARGTTKNIDKGGNQSKQKHKSKNKKKQKDKNTKNSHVNEQVLLDQGIEEQVLRRSAPEDCQEEELRQQKEIKDSANLEEVMERQR